MKEFKDKLGEIINAWKFSDAVEYTRGGNPKPPSIETVNAWVLDAWRAVEPSNVRKSIGSAGFAENETDWHIAKHDIYGEKFLKSRKNAADFEVGEEELEIAFVEDEIGLIDLNMVDDNSDDEDFTP